MNKLLEKMTIVILATCALNIPMMTKELFMERMIEYIYSLHRIFSYSLPVYGVISECTEEDYESTYFSSFPWKDHYCIQDSEKLFGALTKSQKEFMSIQSCISNMSINDDETWIWKMSGRYLLVNDLMFSKLKTIQTDSDAIVKINESAKSVVAYCFALRWKYFKQFYSQSMEQLGTKCVEHFLYEFLKENSIKVTNLVSLGVLSNCNNDHAFDIV